MDIANIGTAADTAVVSLYDPRNGQTLRNDDGSDMTITVYGAESPAHKAVVREQQDRRMARMSKTGKAVITAAEIETNALEVVVRSVKDWNITLGGEKPKATREAVEKVLTSYSWIRAQVEEGIFNSANFFQS